MSKSAHETIDGQEFARRWSRLSPYNEGRCDGFALVDLMEGRHFERQRIPGAMNIPHGEAGVFEQRFDKGKEIIVYAASSRSEAPERVARELTRRGFERVVAYSGGLQEWRAAKRPVAGQRA